MIHTRDRGGGLTVEHSALAGQILRVVQKLLCLGMDLIVKRGVGPNDMLQDD